jgi:hypothetical protein
MQKATFPNRPAMRGPGSRAERFIGLFLIGAVAFVPPILSLFNSRVLLGGIPILYLYVFTVWTVLVVLAALVVSQLPAERAHDTPTSNGSAAERPETES